MASIATVLRLDKINKKGFAPVHFRIIKKRKIRYIITNVWLEKKHWDKKRSKVKSNHPNSNRLNSYLATKFNATQDAVFESEATTKGLSTFSARPPQTHLKPSACLDLPAGRRPRVDTKV